MVGKRGRMGTPAAGLVVLAAVAACARDHRPPRDRLLPASADISRASERPRDPFRDPVHAAAPQIEEIRRGYLLFTQTPRFGAPVVRGAMACTNCHLNAGQRLGGLPLVGAAGAYPQANRRAGRSLSLAERIAGCLLRSTNAAAAAPPGATPHENGGAEAFPSPRSPEVRALAAYIAWISEGAEPLRGQPSIARERLIPVEELDPARGRALYREKCAACHGEDGQGVRLGSLQPGPLWGDRSWTDGAGFARVYMLAAFLRGAMPYSAPGQLRDDEAQQIAAFLDSQPRPVFPEKRRDYPGGAPPPDAVYYPGARLPY